MKAVLRVSCFIQCLEEARSLRCLHREGSVIFAMREGLSLLPSPPLFSAAWTADWRCFTPLSCRCALFSEMRSSIPNPPLMGARDSSCRGSCVVLCGDITWSARYFLLQRSLLVRLPGGAAAWFARGVIADVQAEDESICRRVRAQELREYYR